MHDPRRARLLAFAQLLRLPNVFTAFADIALAASAGLAVAPGWPPAAFWGRVVLIALASGSLYLAGMVWNDVFDLEEDAKARPFRPLPSGRVTKRTAVWLGITLVLVGLTFAGGAGVPGSDEWNPDPLGFAVGLAGLVFLYDGWLKRTPIGPLAMASCRFLNVFLGLSAVPDDALPIGMRLHLAGVVGVYIIGVTWFARTEEGRSSPRQLLAAASVIGVSLALALLVRWRVKVETPGQFLFPYLLVAFGFLVGVPISRAVRKPGPREVQAAVKRCVLGLVAFDAVLAVAFVGAGGLAVLLLLLPALVLGKWVYST
jgi:4-hydroxybenzoate polyprenyltransferase